MYTPIKETLKRLKDDILKQKVKGRYVSNGWLKHSFFLGLLGTICVILGSVMTYSYYNLYEVSVPYSNGPVYLPKSTIYFYIQMNDFYQSNLKYSKSISYDQLKGETETNSKSTEPLDSKRGLDYYPAGILPNTFIQDKFIISDLKINTKGISWPAIRKKIKPSGYTRDEVISPPLWDDYDEIPDLSKNDRFVNWIYTAPFSSFKKLWGTIDVPESGVYDLRVDSKYPYGKKSLLFSQMSWAGTKNYFLSVAMITVGVVGILFSLLIFLKM